MKKLSLSIMELLGLSLGVGRDYYRDFFQDCGYIMRTNYYPRCPEPELTQGTGPHSDTVALTILQQEEALEGLEVFTGGVWQSILPVPGSLVVNIGDTFMVLLCSSFYCNLYSVFFLYSKKILCILFSGTKFILYKVQTYKSRKEPSICPIIEHKSFFIVDVKNTQMHLSGNDEWDLQELCAQGGSESAL
jgi:2OG-Fe(II) oxygenase superfamily